MITCHNCGREMVKRNGPKGAFLGCKGFPRCRNTQSMPVENIRARQYDNVLNPLVNMLSSEQEHIYNFALENNSHMMVSATAGSGKSFIEMLIAKGLKNDNPERAITYLCFNKSIAKEFVPKAYLDNCKACEVSTMHSIGNRILMNYVSSKGLNAHLYKNKSEDIARSFIDESKYGNEYDRVIGDIAKYVNHCKSFMMGGSPEDLGYLADRFGIEYREDYSNYVMEALHRSKNWINGNKFIFDFDDMIWLPIVLNLRFPRNDDILIDEAQDLNVCQHNFIKRFASEGARVVIVGDFKQAIYGWRGADVDSMDNLAHMLGDVSLFPMSTTRRNPTSHVAYINEKLPDYTHVALDDAPEGSIEFMGDDEMIDDVKPHSLMISRVNAPLISYAFKLLRKGKSVYVVGRDFATSIINYIEKMNAKTIPSLIERVESETDKEIERLTKSAKKRGKDVSEMVISSLKDKRDAIIEIALGVKQDNKRANIGNVIDKIRELFADADDAGKPANAVVLSTVHRGKGLESDNVYILTPDLLPHPAAKTTDEIKQEYNCLFVALSRSKDRLIIRK